MKTDAARDEVILAYLPVAVRSAKIAARSLGRRPGLDELVSMASEPLIFAVDRWDAGESGALSTYVWATVRWSVRAEIRRDRTIVPPRVEGRMPAPPCRPFGEGDDPASPRPAPPDVAASAEEMAAAESWLASLTPRRRRLVAMHYDLAGSPGEAGPMSLASIGQADGVSPQAVHQQIKAAFASAPTRPGPSTNPEKSHD